jgi:hypothetical protein
VLRNRPALNRINAECGMRGNAKDQTASAHDAPTCVRIKDKYEGSDRPKPPSTVISIGDYTFRNGHTNSDTPTGTRTPGR